MAIWFVKTQAIIATPSDANDGRDPLGFDVSSASWVAASKELSRAGAFAGYSHESGDIIYISSATASESGWYEIASKDSDDQLTLGGLLHGDGISSDQTDVASSDGPFASLPHAVNEGGSGGNASLSGGDQIRVCDDGTHTLNGGVTLEGMNQSSGNEIELSGWSGRGSAIAKATIQEAGTSVDRMFDADNEYWVYKRLVLDGQGEVDDGIYERSNFQVHYFDIEVKNCVNGFRHRTDPTFAELVECHGCTKGFLFDSEGRLYLTRCVARDCEDGFVGTSGGQHVLRNCIAHSNTSRNFDISDNAVELDACTAYGGGSDGIRLVGETMRIVNTTSSGSGGYGFNLGGTSTAIAIDHNHTHGNTLGPTNLSEGLPGDNNATGDPLFKDADGGDFTPGNGSPLIGAGLAVAGEIDIGAVQAAGGGAVHHAFRSQLLRRGR